MLVKVHLAGRALMAFKKFSVTTCSSFERAVKALRDRFEPESQKTLNQIEFQSMCLLFSSYEDNARFQGGDLYMVRCILGY